MLSKIWAWLRAFGWLLALPFTLLAYALTRRKPKTDTPPAPLPLETVREQLRKQADHARREAEKHREFAEKRITEAKQERARVEALDADALQAEGESYAAKVRARKGALLALLCALTLPAVTHAQDSVPEPALHPLTAELGYWVPEDVWRAALSDALAYETIEAALPALRQSIEVSQAEADSLRAARDYERATSDGLMAQYARDQEALEAARRWYRSPRFWAPVAGVLGFVAGTWIGVQVGAR